MSGREYPSSADREGLDKNANTHLLNPAASIPHGSSSANIMTPQGMTSNYQLYIQPPVGGHMSMYYEQAQDDSANKKRRTNYKNPENSAKLNAAINMLINQIEDQSGHKDLKSISKMFNIPYNTLRDNYLKATTGQAPKSKRTKHSESAQPVPAEPPHIVQYLQQQQQQPPQQSGYPTLLQMQQMMQQQQMQQQHMHQMQHQHQQKLQMQQQQHMGGMDPSLMGAHSMVNNNAAGGSVGGGGMHPQQQQQQQQPPSHQLPAHPQLMGHQMIPQQMQMHLHQQGNPPPHLQQQQHYQQSIQSQQQQQQQQLHPQHVLHQQQQQQNPQSMQHPPQQQQQQHFLPSLQQLPSLQGSAPMAPIGARTSPETGLSEKAPSTGSNVSASVARPMPLPPSPKAEYTDLKFEGRLSPSILDDSEEEELEDEEEGS